MPYSRYSNRDLLVLTSDNEVYRKKILERNAKRIALHATPVYNFDDTEKDIDFTFTEVFWADGDRLYKLSNKYYNSIEYWWVIGFFNQKPTDSHYEIGDLVLIPTPLEKAIEFMGAIEEE